MQDRPVPHADRAARNLLACGAAAVPNGPANEESLLAELLGWAEVTP